MALQDAAPPAPFGNPGVRTADVDFDKRMDVLQSIDFGGAIAYRVWFNLGNQSYSSPTTVEPEGGFNLELPASRSSIAMEIAFRTLRVCNPAP
jgi:hypothetical protein